ncbi:hypothetical protein PoB_004730900 [Plakobranchus ocellatus]|uniref:Uncharacterized protein n=1 Tax=Plakobranchus ocellatus TaxID=259542 RepID=A0AAV4BR33_9GAST|nr:hypothetical protein PoB_004730900 [Plakobranchus ocellatus]
MSKIKHFPGSAGGRHDGPTFTIPGIRRMTCRAVTLHGRLAWPQLCPLPLIPRGAVPGITLEWTGYNAYYVAQSEPEGLCYAQCEWLELGKDSLQNSEAPRDLEQVYHHNTAPFNKTDQTDVTVASKHYRSEIP